MATYPNYAFYQQPPVLTEVAQTLLEALKPYFQELRLEIVAPEPMSLTLQDWAEARLLLARSELRLERFQLQGPVHQIEIWATGQGQDLAIDVANFSAALYASKQVSSALKAEKRRLIQDLHRTLQQNHEMLFSYGFSYDAKYADEVNDSTLNQTIRGLLRGSSPTDIPLLVEHSWLMWLIGLGKDCHKTPLNAVWREIQKNYQPIEGAKETQLWEYAEAQFHPPFLQD